MEATMPHPLRWERARVLKHLSQSFDVSVRSSEPEPTTAIEDAILGSLTENKLKKLEPQGRWGRSLSDMNRLGSQNASSQRDHGEKLKKPLPL
ncbi:uncharacterized protein A4U43_UnF10060 [Asparagus officinalis]|uniref:Uncharacterized protein n=1 Tax=Asparagus officinalis TaxID=4686 RepID=A0A1R3L5J9_ASPOF|nr:uncharacterized protein A4U43_UnF10060 [Asparagus officinalis]